MGESRTELLKIIKELSRNFNSYDVDDFKLFFNLYYANLTQLKEQDSEINNALAELIQVIHLTIQKEKDFRHYFPTYIWNEIKEDLRK